MKKKKASMGIAPPGAVELNVMPFIDIFSLLCTFLLMSAVFLSIGILEVQVPFLTNAAMSEAKKKEKLKERLQLLKEKLQIKLRE